MNVNKIICSETLEFFEECKCLKCAKAIKVYKSLESVPEDGTDQAMIFDNATAHLIFPPDEGDSFDDIMKKAQE
jgi:hypothetical protein